MKSSTERRAAPVRRFFGGMVMRNGELEEAKVWANVGKALCAWMIWTYAEQLLTHENLFAILMLALIAPDLLKKLISMRAGVPMRGEYTERTNTSTRETSTRTKTVPNQEEGDNAIAR